MMASPAKEPGEEMKALLERGLARTCRSIAAPAMPRPSFETAAAQGGLLFAHAAAKAGDPISCGLGSEHGARSSIDGVGITPQRG
jgi:hypothetical protein